MILTEEPTNGLGHHGCGLCPTYAQELFHVQDADGNYLYKEDGEPLLENNQTVSSQEIHDHVAEKHPDQA